jgi:hypothetical protein
MECLVDRDYDEIEYDNSLSLSPNNFGRGSPPSAGKPEEEPDEDQLDEINPLEDGAPVIRIGDLQIAQEFIHGLQNASLDDGNLDAVVLHQLRHPIEAPPDVDDADLLLSIRLYTGPAGTSEDAYKATHDTILLRHPDDPILTYHQVRHKVVELTGVTSITHDMCINTCLAFTGPFSELERCPICGELRFEQDLPSKKSKKRTPRRVFHTIPLGPQLQALWRSPKGAHDIRYRSQCTEELIEMLTENGGTIPTYDDFIHGSDYIDAVNRGDITTDDMVVVFSIDGAQLYKNKHSDCWISIWIVLDHSPDVRYKKRYVLPDTFIPGPNNPKHPDSFLYPSFHHLAALQREGLRIWDASLDQRNQGYMVLHLQLFRHD